MNIPAFKRGLAALLALVLCLTLLPAGALAAVPTSAGWTVREYLDREFVIYRHAAADSASAEPLQDSEIDLRDALHFRIGRAGISYGGLALFRLDGPTDTRTPAEGDTITGEGFYELRCSSSSGSGYTYITPSGVFPDSGSAYEDGSWQVPGGMALQYYAGGNQLYCPAPGYYRFVYFERNSRTICYSGVYHITDAAGLFTGPGSMELRYARAGSETAVNRILSDGVYDLTLSGFTLPDGTAADPAAMTVTKIEWLNDASSYIKPDGSSTDCVVSHPFNKAYPLYEGKPGLDGRTLEARDGAFILRGFTPTYDSAWGDSLWLYSQNYDYIYRVKLTALVGETETVFYSTVPVSVTYHDPSWSLVFDLTYRSNYPAGGNAPDVTEQKIEGLGAALRPGATFAAPEGWRFAGWNTAADGSGTSYLPGQVYTREEDLTLYAQWLHSSYAVFLPAMERVVGSVWLKGIYDEGGDERTDVLWSAWYSEPEDLSGVCLECPAAEGRSYKRLELCAYIDAMNTVIAAYDGTVDERTVDEVSLTATGETWSACTGPEVPGLEENRDYTVAMFSIDGVRASFPRMLSGDGEYRVRLNGVCTSDVYYEYDWSLERSASLAWDRLRVAEMKKLERTIRITGTVKYGTTETPVPFVSVSATQFYGGMQRITTGKADGDGNYELWVFPGEDVTLKAGDSLGYERVKAPLDHVRMDIPLYSMKLFVTVEPELTETEGQAELLRRYCNAALLNGSILLSFPDSSVYSGGLDPTSVGKTAGVRLWGESYPEELDVVLEGTLFRDTEPVNVTLEGGEASVRFAPGLQPGVVVSLAAERSGSYYLAWFDADGKWIDVSKMFSLSKARYDFGFVCPAEEKTGAFQLALLSSAVLATHQGKDLADIDPENVSHVWENVVLREGELTELESASVSEAASLNGYYLTKPASTMRPDRESFSHEAELVRFSGSIGLDKGLENGRLTELVFSPVRGNCASFRALIINGKTVDYDHVEFEEFFFRFDEPIELPCDYTLLCSSERMDMDMDVTLTAGGTYDGGSFRGQLVGSAKVKKPGMVLTTPSVHVCDDTVILTLQGGPYGVYTLCDNGEAIAAIHSGSLPVKLPDTDEELMTVHELYVVDSAGERGESLFIYHWARGPQLRSFTMDWDYIAYGTHPCINVGDHYSHWSAIGMDNVRFTAAFENDDNLDDLPGWEDENGDPVQVVFKVWTSDGVIRFLPAKGSYGSYSATIREHLARAVTHAEVLYQPKPGPTGVTLEAGEFDVVVSGDTKTRAQLEHYLSAFRENIGAYLESKTAADSYLLRWDGETAALEGADPTETGAEKPMLEAWEDTVEQFRGYGMELAGYGVAFESTAATLEWLGAVGEQQLADGNGRPGEFSRSVMYDGSEFFAWEKANAAAVATEHRQTRIGSIVVDQFVLTDAPAEPDPEAEETECLYYVTMTFLSDAEHDTYLSVATANLGGAFEGFPASLQAEAGAASLMDGFEGHYAKYEETKSSFGAAGGSSAVLGTNAATIDMLNDTSKALQMNKGITNAGGAVLGVVDIWQGLEGWKNRTLDNHTMYRDIERFMNSPCYQKLTEGQKQLVQHNFEKFQKAYKATENTDMIVTGANTAMTACSVAAACSGVGAPASLAITLGGVVVGWIGGAVNNAVRKEFVKTYEEVYTSISKIIRAHAYQADDDDCKGEKDGDGSSFSVCFDPSGVVYDGVIENPVQGATVTLYYAVDADGNLLLEGEEALIHELRLAEDVEGLDPVSPVQVTGPDGLYQWFVPEGLWFVTVEYAGRTATSRLDAAATVNASGLTLNGEMADALLPVLPPQLDVNIPLTDPSAPTVESLEWTDEGILVRFSKYMEEADVLSTASYGMKNSAGETVAVTAVEPVERGSVPANIDPAEPAYSRAVLLKASLPDDGAVELTVCADVRSYAGTAMGRAYLGFAGSARFGSLGSSGELSWSYSPESGVITVSGSGVSGSAPVWAAAYDAGGRMTNLLQITAAGSFELAPEAPDVRLFWTDAQGRPKCEAARVR